jgi:hypothetical protein
MLVFAHRQEVSVFSTGKMLMLKCENMPELDDSKSDGSLRGENLKIHLHHIF